MSYLKNLTGKKILGVNDGISHSIPIKTESSESSVEDLLETYIQLVLDEYTLTIYNSCEIIGSKIEDGLTKLEGLYILNINETEKAIEFKLDDGIILKVDLSDEAYYGPEAMHLLGPDDLSVVWN